MTEISEKFQAQFYLNRILSRCASPIVMKGRDSLRTIVEYDNQTNMEDLAQ